jgi:ABC-type nitrate/sulfonate/bicarbonate transport system substrate-binding protein
LSWGDTERQKKVIWEDAMGKFRSKQIYSFLTALAAATLVLAGAAQAQANKLTVGLPTTPPNVVHMPVLVAQDLGLYKKYGVEVETVALEDGVKVYRAMLAGNLDVGMSPGSVTTPRPRPTPPAASG